MQVHFTYTAEEDLDRLPLRLQRRVIEKVEFYSLQPDPLRFAERLAGSVEFRYRIGDYRVIFEVAHDSIWVVAIKRRDEAYR